MKILLDMNLAPGWVEFLRLEGIDAIHWSAAGSADAKDAEVMAWAREHQRIVVTHDLGFSALLALTRARGPSIILLRTQDVLPTSVGRVLAEVLRMHEGVLAIGAILSIDDTATRVRILPIGPAAP